MKYEVWRSKDGTEWGLMSPDGEQYELLKKDVNGRAMQRVAAFEVGTWEEAKAKYEVLLNNWKK